MSSPTPIITKPPKENRVAESDGPKVVVQPIKVSWWKRWSTHLAGINLTAIIASIVLIPERILNAIPNPVWALIGIAFLAVILIPGATSIKQVRKME